MISDRCDFNEFILQVEGRDYQEIIYLADREATEAERRFYHHNTPDQEKALCGQDYARCLKELITFMRYGITPPAHPRRRLGSVRPSQGQLAAEITAIAHQPLIQ